MNTRGIYRHGLKERMKVEIMIQIESSLSIGFGLIYLNQKSTKSTKLNSVGFQF